MVALEAKRFSLYGFSVILISTGAQKLLHDASEFTANEDI